MIGQITSAGISERENSPQPPAQRQFQARMSLVEARVTLLAAVRSLSAGGFTCRAGMIARDVCGVKFGKYQPAEILNWLRSDDFQAKFEVTLQNWKKGWPPAASPMAAYLRETQHQACVNSIREKWWERIADAIESMLAARAQQVVLEDSQGNKRVQSLIDVLDLLFSIPMTAARAARMKVRGVAKVTEEED